MNPITQPELKLISSTGGVNRVIADSVDGKFKIEIETAIVKYTLVTQKNEVRLFSKIDTAWNVMQEVGVNEMIVNI
tara:strand:+ start:55 stop:282 length:228 start_codon:yes stop_codon:yes gene_type:complete